MFKAWHVLFIAVSSSVLLNSPSVVMGSHFLLETLTISMLRLLREEWHLGNANPYKGDFNE